ncbi:hypothetical protein SAMN02745163_01059 [Clostridium cavendishii DSM 21758]|uniref:Uncharacterized protein n=1 Tax=Clostridium cavendishii DSM 21758 TaxID=1121302 RepID=A0A1M6F7V5_9CLOT|nr:hypothetical protein [Clostridium cavendishii]SHI93763.1 hypothetical protein SAMN02745163_01059 [Clostridium cavendishii DSM 21758]
MKDYIEIINNDEKLFTLYEIIRVTDNTFLIPDAYVNTDGIRNFVKKEIIDEDLEGLVINEGDTIAITWWDERGRLIQRLRLDSANNDSFGFLTVKSPVDNDGRHNITSSIANLYKHIKGVHFQYYLLFNHDETLLYMKNLDEL